MPFDQQSGIVFREVVRTTSHDRCGCLNAYRARGRKPVYVPPSSGPLKLVEIARRRVLCSLADCSVQALQEYGQLFVEKLWDAVKRHQLNSLVVWQLFASTGYFDHTFLHVAKSSCQRCTHEKLRESLRLGDCVHMKWTVDLTLGSEAFNEADLIDVAVNLSNVRNIYITTANSDEKCNYDRVLREWAVAAREKGAFTKLQMIFADPGVPITPLALQHLNHFPVLDTFAVVKEKGGKKRKEEILEEAKKYGWIEDTDNRVDKYLNLTAIGCPGKLANSWSEAVNNYIAARRLQINEANVPVLSLIAGKPGKAGAAHPAREDVCTLHRDWNFTSPPRTSSRAPLPTIKRRKLNTRKAFAIDDIINAR